MRTTMRLFATYREQAGTGRVEVSPPAGATVKTAIALLLDATPRLPRDFRPYLIAVNEEFANPDYPLHDGDEVALYPPVSGGVDARVVREPLDARALTSAVRRSSNGAVVTFEGTTRDETDGRRVLHLEYEAHEAMAEKVLGQVLEETACRFGLSDVAARHRLGRLEIGDVSLVVVVAAPHRLEAFLAAQYAVDRIKHIVPVWKQEHFADGAVWVGAACEPERHAYEQATAPYARFLAARDGGQDDHRAELPPGGCHGEVDPAGKR